MKIYSEEKIISWVFQVKKTRVRVFQKQVLVEKENMPTETLRSSKNL